MQLLARRVTAVVITAAIGVVSFGVATSVVAQSRVQPAGAGGAAPTGAASDASAAVEELKLGQVTDVRVGSDIVFPVDSYRMSPEDQNVVFLAEHKAMQSCMARFGESFDVRRRRQFPPRVMTTIACSGCWTWRKHRALVTTW